MVSFFFVYKKLYYTVYLHILWYVGGGKNIRVSSKACGTKFLKCVPKGNWNDNYIYLSYVVFVQI